jgi:flagellar hook-length control protein FliK
MLPNSLFDIASSAKAGSAGQALHKQNARSQKPVQGFEPILEAARETPPNRGVKDASGKSLPPHKYVKPAHADKAQDVRAAHPDNTGASPRLPDDAEKKPVGDADLAKASRNFERYPPEHCKTGKACENPAGEDAATDTTETGDVQTPVETTPSTAMPSEAGIGESAEAAASSETGTLEGALNDTPIPEVAGNGQIIPPVTQGLTPNILTDLAGLEAGAGTENADAATLQGQGAVALLTAATQLEAAQSTPQKATEAALTVETSPEAGTFEIAVQDGLATVTSDLPKSEASASSIEVAPASGKAITENAGTKLTENTTITSSKTIEQNTSSTLTSAEKTSSALTNVEKTSSGHASPEKASPEKAAVLHPEAKGTPTSVPQIGSRLATPDQEGAERFSDIVDAPYGLRGFGEIVQTMDRILLDKAQAGASTQQSQHLRPTPLQMLPIEIGMQAMRGTNSFQIRLDPAELGRVDVKLEVNKQGEVSAHLIVERPETLQMLRRDSTTLQYAFEQAGLKSSQDGLSFSLKGEGQNGQQQSQNGSAPGREEDENTALKAQIEHLSLRRMMIPNSSIDRVI